jgi:iron complex transport system substrate-binding protein
VNTRNSSDDSSPPLLSGRGFVIKNNATLKGIFLMNRKLLLILIVALLTLYACASNETRANNSGQPTIEEVEWPLIITDDLGNTIELSEYPHSIVSISPSTTEILFAIGAGEQVVGRDEFSLFPEEALEVENIGSLWEGVPTEAILALEPDLVIAAQIVSEENIQVLLDLGLPVYWQANPADFAGLYENLLNIAEITGHTETAQVLVDDLQTRVQAVESAVTAAEETPSVFYELDATDPANPWTTGSGTFIDYILNLAGGLNAAAALQGDYTQISAEELIAVNPDIILLADALYGVTPESVAERPGWDAIDAVQSDSIYPIDPNMMSVPGPRLVDALEATARLINPEFFE